MTDGTRRLRDHTECHRANSVSEANEGIHPAAIALEKPMLTGGAVIGGGSFVDEPPLPLGEGWGEGAVKARTAPSPARSSRFNPLPEGEADALS
jgi:hypothetical protein